MPAATVSPYNQLSYQPIKDASRLSRRVINAQSSDRKYVVYSIEMGHLSPQHQMKKLAAAASKNRVQQ